MPLGRTVRITDVPHIVQVGDPRGADATDLINEAIASVADITDGGIIQLGPYTYQCSGKIDLFYNGGNNAEKRGCYWLRGASGIGYGQNNVPVSRLLYTGSGDRFIDARSSNARISNCSVLYTSDQFTGSLIDYGWYPKSTDGLSSGDSNGGIVEGCLLGSWTLSGPRPTTADNLVHLGNSIFMAVRDCKLIGSTYGIRGSGLEQGGALSTSYFSNGVRIDNCEFAYCHGAAILNPAQAWRITSCGFEGLRSEVSYDTPLDTGMDHAVISDADGETVYGLEISGCWFGDPGGSDFDEVWVDNGPQTWRGVTITGNQFGASGVETGIRVEGSARGWLVAGNAFSTKTAIEFVAGAARHEGVVITGNDFSATSPDHASIVGMRSGVSVLGNFGKVRGLDPAERIVMPSPDGTLYAVSVADGGGVVTVAV